MKRPAVSPAAGGEQAVFVGGEYGRAAAADAEFDVDGSDVALDGVHRHGQIGGDLVEGEHGREQPEDGEFPFAQHGVPVLAARPRGEYPLGKGLGGSEAAVLVHEQLADAGRSVGERPPAAAASASRLVSELLSRR